MERESGYYRVKCAGSWTVMYYNKYWAKTNLPPWSLGYVLLFEESNLQQIDENRITMPDEENG